jgi:SWI/SNF-related matrix-associated actin-dependent regulator of chromatin subfamily A3
LIWVGLQIPRIRFSFTPTHARCLAGLPLINTNYTTMAPQKRRAQAASSQAQTHAPKQARTTYDSRASGSSQHEPLVIESDDDDGNEEDASQNEPDSTQGPSEQEYSYSLYGALHNKIVGVRYYSGYATVGEMVICRREPNNPYDSNAIRVLNVQGDQIGHIPKTWAAKIAKYMDNRSLLVEATITGPKGEFDCPLELKFYGTNEPEEREKLLSKMRADKLPVGPAADRKRKEAAAQKERQRLAKEAAKQAKKNGGTVVGVDDGQTWENGMSEYMAGSSQMQGAGPGPSLEDIIGGSERFNARNFENIVEEFGVKEDDLVSIRGRLQRLQLTVYRH